MSVTSVRPPVSVMIFTLNEEVHLPSCLAALSWCDDVIVIDSFSTDGTERICREAGARFFQHGFEGFGAQRNWAIDNAKPLHEWILILDADERVTAALVEEMDRVLKPPGPSAGAFRVKRRFHMWGRWLRHSSLYPTWVVRLIHRDRVRYINRGHAETQEVLGATLDLHEDLIDENLKGIDEWFERQNRYSTKDAVYELGLEAAGTSGGSLLGADPLERRAAMKRIVSRMPLRTFAYFIYAYVLRGGFLDGRDGLVFCTMRALYQGMVEAKKHDLRRAHGK